MTEQKKERGKKSEYFTKEEKEQLRKLSTIPAEGEEGKTFEEKLSELTTLQLKTLLNDICFQDYKEEGGKETRLEFLRSRGLDGRIEKMDFEMTEEERERHFKNGEIFYK